MKVLEDGRPQSGWAAECRCTGSGNGGGGCGAVLLVEQDDVFRTETSFCGRDVEACATFACPRCHVWTDLDVPFVPRQWRPSDGRSSGEGP